MNKVCLVTALVIFLILLSVPVAALTYEQMARFPDQNIGDPITLTGKASQVIYEGEYWAIMLQTKKNSWGYSGDDVFVIFQGLSSGGRVLEDDIVQVSGGFMGPYDYETVMGAHRSIPSIFGTSYLINPVSGRY